MELVNLYINGLPYCRCSVPFEIRDLARQEGVSVNCTMYKDEALRSQLYFYTRNQSHGKDQYRSPG